MNLKLNTSLCCSLFSSLLEEFFGFPTSTKANTKFQFDLETVPRRIWTKNEESLCGYAFAKSYLFIYLFIYFCLLYFDSFPVGLDEIEPLLFP